MKFYRLFTAIALIAIAIVAPLDSGAFKFTQDGVIYSCNKSNKRASVQGPENIGIKKVDIPERILSDGDFYTVTSIASNAFQGCTSLPP